MVLIFKGHKGVLPDVWRPVRPANSGSFILSCSLASLPPISLVSAYSLGRLTPCITTSLSSCCTMLLQTLNPAFTKTGKLKTLDSSFLGLLVKLAAMGEGE